MREIYTRQNLITWVGIAFHHTVLFIIDMSRTKIKTANIFMALLSNGLNIDAIKTKVTIQLLTITTYVNIVEHLLLIHN